MGLLLLVRHGQASFGASDYDVLSDLGVRQAQRAGQRLRGQAGGVRRVVAGAMRRQQDTARHLLQAAGLDLPVHTDERWNEYDVGDIVAQHLPAGRSAAQLTDSRAFQELLDEALVTWTSGRGDHAEPYAAFRARVAAALQDVREGPGTTVVVTSAGVLGAVAATLLGGGDPVWAAVTRVQVNAAFSKVVTGRSGSSLVSVNDHAHLEAEPGLVTYR